MGAEIDSAEVPTRRDAIKGSGTILGGGLLGGCTGPDDGATASPTDATATDAATSTEASPAPYDVTDDPGVEAAST